MLRFPLYLDYIIINLVVLPLSPWADNDTCHLPWFYWLSLMSLGMHFTSQKCGQTYLTCIILPNVHVSFPLTLSIYISSDHLEYMDIPIPTFICYGCITIQVNIAYFYDIYILKYMIAFHYLLHQNRHTSPLTPFWHLQLNCLLFRASTVQPLQTADYHIAVKTKGKWCVNMYNCTSWWTKHVLAGKQINLQQTERPQMARQIVWVCPYYARVWVLLWRKKQEDK